MADELDLVVHAFQGAVGNPKAGPRQDAVAMIGDHSGEFLKRFQSGMTGPPQPQLGSSAEQMKTVKHNLDRRSSLADGIRIGFPLSLQSAFRFLLRRFECAKGNQ